MSEELKFPDNLRYSKEHQWVKVEDGIALVGISDFAQSQLTDVVFVELPEVGSVVEQNSVMSTIESVKSVSDVYAPVSGEVIEINQELEDNPEKVNEDCYVSGWIAKIKVKDESELDNLMAAEEYKKFVSENNERS